MKNTIKILLTILAAGVLFSCNKNPLDSYNHSSDYKVKVDSVTLSPASKVMVKGEELQLNAAVYPKGASDKSLLWTSSNDKVAFVNQSGLVAALAIGDAVITVTTADGGFSRTCAITVKAPDPIFVTNVSLDITTVEVEAGKSVTLTATVEPEDADDRTVTWEIVNSDGTSPCCASITPGVNNTAVVTGISEGTATVTVITNGKNKEGQSLSASCTVTVKGAPLPPAPVEKISGDIEDINYESGEKE